MLDTRGIDHRVIRIQRSRLIGFLGLAAAYLLGACAASGAGPPTASQATGSAAQVCSLYAAPGGSDSRGTGSSRHPFASLTRLDRSLHPGQAGCLRSGTYGGVSTWNRI